MARKFVLDPELEKFATKRQWEIMQALAEHGTGRQAAEALQLSKSAVNDARAAVYRKAADQGYAPASDWEHVIPDGHKIRGVSTYYGKDGDKRGQWVKTERDRERQLAMFQAMAEGFASGLPRALPETERPEHTAAHLMACYPVSDHHYGMLSWHEETGGNYDLKIAEELLFGAIDYLMTRAPSCPVATIVFLGDFMHYDSFTPETPTSRNQLDADSRFPDMVKYAIRGMRYSIRKALARHSRVHVIVEIGNHDLACSIMLMQALDNVYENEPRVTIDTSPRHYHYFTHGKVLVGVHHGHGAKLPDLPLIMASDRKEDWGASDYRYWWTGHVHIDQAKDYRGVKVESFRILAPVDAWAAQKGYRAMQDMKCILLHDQYGEVARHTVNPEMLK